MGIILSILRPGLFLATSPPPHAASSPPSSSPPPHATSSTPPSSPPAHDGVELVGVEPQLSTGRSARRRRQHLNRRLRKRTATDAKNGAASSGTTDLKLHAATKNAASDAKNGAASSGTTELKLHSDTKNAASDAKNGAASSGTTDLKLHAATKNAASDAKNGAASSGTSGLGLHALTSDAKKKELFLDAATDASAEAASSMGAADPRIAEPASTDPNALGLHTPAIGIGFPLDASPVPDHDGLHGAALTVAATSTDQKWNKVPEKKWRAPPAPPSTQHHLPAASAARSTPFAPRDPPATPRTRPHLPPAARSPAFAPRAPAAAAVGQQRPPATAVGLLDDLKGVENFFGNLFQEEVDEDEKLHRGYSAACSALNKKYIICLACFISEDKRKPARIVNDIRKVNKHMESEHKGDFFRCEKKGCFAMATNRKDIGLHQLYAHQM